MFHTHVKSIVAILCIALCQFCLTGPTNADFLYVVHGGVNAGAPFGGEIGYVNLDTLEYSSLGTPVPGAGLTGIAYTSNQLYASTSNHSLAILNLKGGLISETSFFGSDFDVAAGDRVTDLAATRSGDLYASVGLIGGNNRLFSLEPSTGELVLIGPLPANDGPFMSLAFIGGSLFGHSADEATVFYEIDIATGAATNTISGGVSTGALGLGFNPNNEQLYASTGAGFDRPHDQIFSLNPVSGVAVQLVDFNDDRRIHDLEYVPQPRFDQLDMYVVHGGANVGAPFGGELGIVDTDTGVYISLGTPVPGAGLTGLAYSGTRLFASTSNHTLAVMDISGGLLSDTPFVGGGFNAAAGDRVTDLASNSVGQIYAAARIGGVDTLCLVFSDIAELFPIGPLPTDTSSFHALAFAAEFASDRLYNHQAVFPGVFNEIDVTTGASLNVIPGGVPGGTIALGYNRVDRKLYGSEFELATQYSERIYSVDPSTGAAVKIFDFNDGRRIHDIEFIDDRVVKLVLSESVTPTRGIYVAGGIGELAFSDNADYQMRRNIADVRARTEFVVKGISPTPAPSSLEMTLEGSVFARSTVVQSIDLYDYNTGAWEAIGASIASRFVDSTVYVEAHGDLSRFVQPVTGYMEARIRYQSSNPRQQFASNTDLFNWMIGL